MEKRLYVKPETVISDITFSHSILENSGIAGSGLTKEREDIEEGMEEESAKMTNEYSLW